MSQAMKMANLLDCMCPECDTTCYLEPKEGASAVCQDCQATLEVYLNDSDICGIAVGRLDVRVQKTK